MAARRMDRLRAADLLRRFPGEAQPPCNSVPLHRRLDGKKPTERRHPEPRMWVGVPCRLIAESLPRRTLRGSGLAVSGHPVVFGIETDHGPRPVRPLGAECGGHSAGAFLDRESFRPQALHVPRRGAILPPRRFAEVEDRGASLRKHGHPRGDRGSRGVLSGRERRIGNELVQGILSGISNVDRALSNHERPLSSVHEATKRKLLAA